MERAVWFGSIDDSIDDSIAIPTTAASEEAKPEAAWWFLLIPLEVVYMPARQISASAVEPVEPVLNGMRRGAAAQSESGGSDPRLWEAMEQALL